MSNDPKKRLKKGGIVIMLLLIVLFIIINIGQFRQKEVEKDFTYDQFITYVKNGEVIKIVAKEDSNQVTVTTKDNAEKKVVVPDLTQVSSLVLEEIQNGVQIQFSITQVEWWRETVLNILLSFLTSIVIIFIFSKRISDIGGKYQVEPVHSKIKFSDVAGIDEEREQLTEVVNFLNNPKKYASMGAKIPKGILLNGEPGTGKTLLAKAIAGEAGVPFFEVNGSSFEEKFVGVGASRVRKLFKKAEKFAPCIIFIDEFDSVAKSRYSNKSYNNEQTLNQLLSEMDGFNTKDNIIVIAATNHVEVLDSAIVRPGRFDRRINIPMPDVIAREKILQIHAKDKKIAEDVSLKEVAKKTVGFSGADLANILNEAAIYAVNQKKVIITKSDIDEAIARVLVGLEKKNSAITQEDKRRAAVHEAGHAIASAIVRPELKNFGISIVPRGNSAGYNFFDNSDRMFSTKEELENEIKVLYGGRVAEKLILGSISTGASKDLEVACKKAFSMVTQYAMNDRLLVRIQEEENYNQHLESKKIDEAEKICKDAYDSIEEKMELCKTQILKLSNLLMEKEYLSQEDVKAFMKANEIKKQNRTL